MEPAMHFLLKFGSEIVFSLDQEYQRWTSPVASSWPPIFDKFICATDCVSQLGSDVSQIREAAVCLRSWMEALAFAGLNYNIGLQQIFEKDDLVDNLRAELFDYPGVEHQDGSKSVYLTELLRKYPGYVKLDCKCGVEDLKRVVHKARCTVMKTDQSRCIVSRELYFTVLYYAVVHPEEVRRLLPDLASVFSEIAEGVTNGGSAYASVYHRANEFSQISTLSHT